MSRNKVEANKTIFKRLDEYASARAETIANAGEGRWIGTDEISRKFLTDAKLIRSLIFSARMLMSQFEYEDRTYLVTAGFETTDVPDGLLEEGLTAGILTAFIAESELQPNVGVLDIKQVVEYGDARTPEYMEYGHDFRGIAGLFPAIQVFSSETLEKKESENVFLLLCLADRRRIELWIDESLVEELKLVTELGASRIPYSSLCKSCLDADPGSLFLALYRSLENQYSRKKVTDLMTSMGLARDWTEMASLLGDKLNWYPRELESLDELLNQIPTATLTIALKAFGSPQINLANQASTLAKQIYGLRNTLVHFRPFHVGPDPNLDWNNVCTALCRLLRDLY